MNQENKDILEFDIIKEMLIDNAVSDSAKINLRKIEPILNEVEVKQRMRETTEAKRILESLGNPPISQMKSLYDILIIVKQGGVLTPEQLNGVGSFAYSCKRLSNYLKKSEFLQVDLCYYWSSINDLRLVSSEIEKAIRNDRVDDYASNELRDIRRKIESTNNQIKMKLEQLLRSKKEWFSDSFVVNRNGRSVLPVKKEYKHQVNGTVMDKSSTGATYFIEPTVVGKLHEELTVYKIDEENEIRKILYILTGVVEEYIEEIKSNIEITVILDMIFAKAKLSASMKAIPVEITSERRIKIVNGRHPLLSLDNLVPLDFEIGGEISGIVITGPNTGGKTVALKTVGLLTTMAQSGLHIPVDNGSIIGMQDKILCDIGDGQSITENLSTFSSHIKNVIHILSALSNESLVLLDELGSGTDPAEGMGIAIAILERLKKENCLFVATTHYPEVKDYASVTSEIKNARMAFDHKSLKPLYKLEIGLTGESCALSIAKRLGLPDDMIDRAYQEAYKTRECDNRSKMTGNTGHLIVDNEKVILDTMHEMSEIEMMKSNVQRTAKKSSQIIKEVEKKPKNSHASIFKVGDSVIVYPNKVIGIVYEEANHKGEVNVQIKGRKSLISHKRLKIKASASDMYPENYDFSIVFDSVKNRKANHNMNRKYDPNIQATYDRNHNGV